VHVRAYSNEQSTLLKVQRHEDIEYVERNGILARYDGILSHDHESVLLVHIGACNMR
jgi:hypothetical protein